MKTNQSLPVMLAIVSNEGRAFERALKKDILSECSNRDNYIEHFNYVGDFERQHLFQNTITNQIVKCPL